MLGKTHKLGGFCTGIIVSTAYLNNNFTTHNLEMAGLFIAGCTLGAMIPDIDHKGSTISNKNLANKLISNIVSLFGHRGITHSPFLYILLTFIINLICKDLNNKNIFFIYIFLMGCMIGAFSHLFLDFLTKGGIPLFFPISKRKYHLLPLKTGKCDSFICFLLIIGTIAFVVFKIL